MKNRIKELSYYLFFGLMIFSKGIGLDSGDKLYYILSAAACVCVLIKLVLTKYNIKEITAMVLLCLIAFIAYINSGRMGIVLSVLTIVGIKDMDVKKLFRLGTVVYGLSFATTVLMAWTGIINNPFVVHEKGKMEVIRWGMGYSTGNIFHVSYFMLSVLLCYTWGKRYRIKNMMGLMAGNLLVFLFSLSYTGVAVTTFYLCLNFYAVKRKQMNMVERVICQFPLPLSLLFSFGMPFLLQYPVVQKLNVLLQARLSFSAYYLQNQPITLFGTRMKDVPNFWIIMDNGYVYFFMTFGIIAFVLFCAGYAALIAKYSKEKRTSELAIIFSFLLYGIMEQFIANSFMNLSLLFMGEVLFGGGKQQANQILPEDCKKENCKTETKKERKFKWLVCGGIGIAVCVIYLAAVPIKEYVKVPLRTLNFVDAESIEIYIINNDGTKAGLKQEIEKYRDVVSENDLLKGVISDAGVEGRLSEKELKEALDYSIPMYVRNQESYDLFRIRILELYCDISEREYSKLLNGLIERAQMIVSEQYKIKDGVYRERVYKSEGEDRIEHIKENEKYAVEKEGIITKVEYARNGIAYIILAMAAADGGMYAGKYIKKRSKFP